MQACDSGNKNQDAINFRPSPNFKHMKKYLKSKFEEDMNSGTVSQSTSEQQNKGSTVVQPPLPPDSPPPDSPQCFTVKQEVEEEEYDSTERSDDSTLKEFPIAEDIASDEKLVMCKDFVRGTCTRGVACTFVHKIILSQLKNVYRFCRDFENNRCVRPVCNFVHATTFEKEHFMRTAQLPPHATAHLPRHPSVSAATGLALGSAHAQIPISGAPATSTASTVSINHQNDVGAELAPLFANAPAAALASGAGAGGVGGATACAGAGALEARMPLEALPALPTLATMPSTSRALKRDWRSTDGFSSPPRDLDSNDPLAKKCKRCDITELRMQHAKAQVTDVLRSTQELDSELERVINETNRLHHVLKVLLKPWRGVDNVSNGNFIGEDRLSMLENDGKNDVLMSQFKFLLTKMLLESEALPSEKSRDLAT